MQLVQIMELEQLEAELIVADPQPGRVGLAAGRATVENSGASFGPHGRRVGVVQVVSRRFPGPIASRKY